MIYPKLGVKNDLFHIHGKAGEFMSLRRFYVAIVTLLFYAIPLHAVTPIEPFVGQYSEGFETFNYGDLPGETRSEAGPFCLFDNHAQLSGSGRNSFCLGRQLGPG